MLQQGPSGRSARRRDITFAVAGAFLALAHGAHEGNLFALPADMAGERAMLAAERKRGQASIGIGANLATAFQNYSVASYQWNASWFAAFVDQAAAAGVFAGGFRAPGCVTTGQARY